VHAAGMTLVEYTATRLGVSGHKAWSKRPQGFAGGRILGRVSSVVHAAGMTLVEYTAAGLGGGGHQVCWGPYTRGWDLPWRNAMWAVISLLGVS